MKNSLNPFFILFFICLVANLKILDNTSIYLLWVETRNMLFLLEFIIITIVAAPEFVVQLGCWVSSHHHVVCSSPKIWSKTWPVNLFIFSGENRPVLDWPTRIKVAAGSARGIAYLHEDCKFLLFHSILKYTVIIRRRQGVSMVLHAP